MMAFDDRIGREKMAGYLWEGVHGFQDNHFNSDCNCTGLPRG